MSDAVQVRAEGRVDPSPFTLWFLATLPIDNGILFGLLGQFGVAQSLAHAATLSLYVVAFQADLRAFRRARPGCGRWLAPWFFFLPVYLWKRCRRGGGSFAPFWTNLGILVAVVGSVVLAFVFLIGKQTEAQLLVRTLKSRMVLAAPSFPDDPEEQKAAADEVLKRYPRDARARLAKARSLHDHGGDDDAERMLIGLLRDKLELARFPKEGYAALALEVRIRAERGDETHAKILARFLCRATDRDAEEAKRSLVDKDLCPPDATAGEVRPEPRVVASPSTAVGVTAPALSNGSSGLPADRLASVPPVTRPYSNVVVPSGVEPKPPSKLGVEDAEAKLVADGFASVVVDGWTIYDDTRRHIHWIFPARSDPAWPVLGIRRTVTKDGGVSSRMKLVCEGASDACMDFAKRIGSFESRAFGDSRSSP